VTSKWRLYSRKVIAAAIASVPDGDVTKIKKAIDKAYPFGSRENHPYKMWLIERRIALVELEITG
jgi:hypothetical protein